jgi:hypothetical protein
MLPEFLDYPFLIALPVFSNVYLMIIPEGQSRMDNPETLATLGTIHRIIIIK